MVSAISFVGRPDVFHEDVFAIFVGADRVFVQIDLQVTGKSIGNNQRRGGKIVCLDLRADTTFEVTVARQNGGHEHVVAVNCLDDRVGQRTGVPDTGGTTETGNVKAKLVEIGLKTGFSR